MLVLATLTFSSCADSGPSAAGDPTTPAPTATSAAPADPAPSASSTSSAATGAPSASAAATAPATFDASRFQAATFVTPSGNITCNLTDYQGQAMATCEIASHTYAAPERPADCELDYGLVITLDEEARFLCVSDTMMGAADLDADQYGDLDHVAWFSLTHNEPLVQYGFRNAVLGYDQTVKVGEISCKVTRAGVLCDNARTNHGFTLSKASYDLRSYG